MTTERAGGQIEETKTPLGSSYQQRPSIGLFQERVRPMLPSHSVAVPLPRRIFSVSLCLRVSLSPCLLVFLSFALAAWTAGPAYGHGLLIPEDRKVPPLAMVNHQVTITIDDQVAETRVEQTFRNHTARALEATYVFPVPKGASVRKFTMWVNGKETAGEMVEADKARHIYTDIVRRTQDPGLLEYMGNNLLRMRVFPILPKAEQKVALSFTAIAPRDAGVVEYLYPLKTDGKATRTLEDFAIQANIKSQHPIINVYSPTHSITTKKNGDREVNVNFERRSEERRGGKECRSP